MHLFGTILGFFCFLGRTEGLLRVGSGVLSLEVPSELGRSQVYSRGQLFTACGVLWPKAVKVGSCTMLTV